MEAGTNSARMAPQSQGNLGLVRGGGVICDHRGLWMKEFTRFIGVWALRDGLLM